MPSGNGVHSLSVVCGTSKSRLRINARLTNFVRRWLRRLHNCRYCHLQGHVALMMLILMCVYPHPDPSSWVMQAPPPNTACTRSPAKCAGDMAVGRFGARFYAVCV